MRKLIFNLILCSIILVISGCKEDNFPAPMEFKANEYNPILSPGEPGSWDDYIVALPQVIKDNNVFYMFYMGFNVNGVSCIGLATSIDGFIFNKFERNPVLVPDGNGFDAFNVGAPVVMKQDSVWVMYFNCLELSGWGPGHNIGRANASALTGPWIKDDKPLLIAGRWGEWDSEYLFPGSVLKLDDGSYRMYYSGGADFSGNENQYLGMANSTDGINWNKYNDPTTKEHPFADSDPVLITGNQGEWDSQQVWTSCVLKNSYGYEMYYGGGATINNFRIMAAGYATSYDGIDWEKFPVNPVFRIDYNFGAANNVVEVSLEGPSLIFLDTVCFMYYDYVSHTTEVIESVDGGIRIATAVINR